MPVNPASLSASDFDQSEQYTFSSGTRKVYVTRDEIGRNRYVYCVGIVGDPHSQITETTLASAKFRANTLLKK